MTHCKTLVAQNSKLDIIKNTMRRAEFIKIY